MAAVLAKATSDATAAYASSNKRAKERFHEAVAQLLKTHSTRGGLQRPAFEAALAREKAVLTLHLQISQDSMRSSLKAATQVH